MEIGRDIISFGSLAGTVLFASTVGWKTPISARSR